MSDPSRVYNADEAAFFLNPKGQKVLVPRGEKSVYSLVNTDEKENLTVLLTANAAGMCPPPLIVFKYSRLSDALLQLIPGDWAVGRSPDSGWMTSELFYEYIVNQFNGWLLKIT